jgi:hypothetical protein
MGAGSSTTAKFAEQVAILRRELEAQQRTDFPIAKRVYLAVDDDAAAARDQVRAGLHRLYGDLPGITEVPVAGTPEEVLAGLHEVAEAGAELLLLNPLGADVAADREQLERLAADVLARW